MDTPLGSVLYITLGCAKNEVDTDRMRSLLTTAGYELKADKLAREYVLSKL